VIRPRRFRLRARLRSPTGPSEAQSLVGHGEGTETGAIRALGSSAVPLPSPHRARHPLITQIPRDLDRAASPCRLWRPGLATCPCAVAALELLDHAGSVDELLLAGVEGWHTLQISSRSSDLVDRVMKCCRMRSAPRPLGTRVDLGFMALLPRPRGREVGLYAPARLVQVSDEGIAARLGPAVPCPSAPVPEETGQFSTSLRILKSQPGRCPQEPHLMARERGRERERTSIAPHARRHPQTLHTCPGRCRRPT